jgi:hypothetical protein
VTLRYRPVVDRGTNFRQTDSRLLSAGWNNIVSTGNFLLFYRRDGIVAVGYVDRNGRFPQTYSAGGAIALYCSAGCSRINAFGKYDSSPLSVFMGKEL